MALSNDTQNILRTNYETLLMGYAAGILNQGQNLAVSAHLAYSIEARTIVGHCEAIGGALMETESNLPSMNAGSLENVLSRLDDAHMPANTTPIKVNLGFNCPKPIREALKECPAAVRWNTLFPGMKSYDLDLKCDQSVARFMKAEPGTKSPSHSHGGTEVTLVLDGAFHDETGQYKVGDLIVTDEDMDHTPIACERLGCTCLVVTSEPIKLKGIASILNPFLKP